LDDPHSNLSTLLLLGAIFRCIVGHDNGDLGIFGKCIHIIKTAVKCVSLGFCDVAKEVHKGSMKGLSKCSPNVRDSDTISAPSPPPCYTVSPQYISEQFLFISHFVRSNALMKCLLIIMGNLILWFNFRLIPLLMIWNSLLPLHDCDTLDEPFFANIISTSAFVSCSRRPADYNDQMSGVRVTLTTLQHLFFCSAKPLHRTAVSATRGHQPTAVLNELHPRNLRSTSIPSQ
jgi:hypothetical protein